MAWQSGTIFCSPAWPGSFGSALLRHAPAYLRGSGEYPPGVEVEEIPRAWRAAGRAAALARSALTGEAYPAALYRSRALSSRLSRWMARERPAWIVAHSYHVAPAILGRGPSAWVDFHNMDSEIWRRMGERAASAASRALARWQAPRVERMERRILRRLRERPAFRSGTREPSPRSAALVPLVVSNGVDLARYAFR